MHNNYPHQAQPGHRQTFNPNDSGARSRWLPFALVLTLLGLLAVLSPAADAQERGRELGRTGERQAVRVQPAPLVEKLRLHCQVEAVNGQRGVSCQWSASSFASTRAYQLYRIVDGQARELVSTSTPDQRLAHFDADLVAPSTVTYGVVAVNRAGRVVAQSPARTVELGDPVDELRLACEPRSIDDQRGVLCRWSEASEARGYVVYRIADDGVREQIAVVAANERHFYFDVEPAHSRSAPNGVVLTYAVIAVDASGHPIAQSAARSVAWPT